MLYFKFDEVKAISALLLIAKKLQLNNIRPDFHKIFKILYFADQKHIVKYGRPIIGDHYIAMNYGPVPSRIYDILKMLRGDSIFEDTGGYGDSIQVQDRYVYPKRDPDMDVFSESNIECIHESMEENQYLSFSELREKSHGYAYERATKDDKISFRAMAKEAGSDASILSYMRDISENELVLKS